jgi:hypothetical protein
VSLRPKSSYAQLPPNRKPTTSIAEAARLEKGKIIIAAINIKIVRERMALTVAKLDKSHRIETRGTRMRQSIFILSVFALMEKKSSQFQQAINHQTKPEIDQGPEVKLERVMLGAWGEIGIEGEIQAITKQNGNQVFEPFHRYRFHLRHPVWARSIFG